jgi:hypothetical protein
LTQPIDCYKVATVKLLSDRADAVALGVMSVTWMSVIAVLVLAQL